MKIKFTSVILLLTLCLKVFASDMKTADPKDIALTPIQNSFRNRIDLSGIWKFKKDTINIGIKEQWFNRLNDFRQIAVPGSWNDQFTDMRDYLKWVWYETETYIPKDWKGQQIFIRVNDATYAAKIWVNGKSIGQHEGCHVPFAFEINDFIKWDSVNRITIQVENLLKPDRIPTGNVPGSAMPNYPGANYDFFPYSGLNRSVLLYSVPAKSYIKDITVRPDFEGTTGKLNILVEQSGNVKSGIVKVSGFGTEIEKEITFNNSSTKVTVEIPDVHLWSPESPDLYEVTVELESDGKIIDQYSLETGVRTVSVNEKSVLLNGKPIFLKGYGKHEDFPIVGRGSANPVIIKDFSLMKWTGANSFRTSHYPYAEEFYSVADKEGIMIIGETPTVGMFFLGDSTELAKRQAVCKQYIREMIYRDKNHPSVIMWSVANEPSEKAKLGMHGSDDKTKFDPVVFSMFKEYFDLAKELDPTRLVIYVAPGVGPSEWYKLTDVVAINRYMGWYEFSGDIKKGAEMLSQDLDEIYREHKKPIIISEFGADTYAGLHSDQEEMFSEEFQKEFIKAYLDVADSKDYVTGMHVWNFADFKTSQSFMRFGGYNLKGIFTRERKPKMAASYLRERWNGESEK